jgi:heme-degrading monooxygenase HmoA
VIIAGSVSDERAMELFDNFKGAAAIHPDRASTTLKGLKVTETYTSGTWIVTRGEDEAFVQAWTDFVRWAGTVPGSGTFRLVRDVERPDHYMSFAPWESFDAQQAWKELPEFRERIGRVRSHCEDFQPSTLELVTRVG